MPQYITRRILKSSPIVGSSNSRYLDLSLGGVNIIILTIKSDITVLMLIITAIATIDLFFN